MMLQMIPVAMPYTGIVRGFTPWIIYETQFAPAPGFASITFNVDGSITASANVTVPGAPRWFEGTVSGSHWIRWTNVLGGVTPNGGSAINTWLELNAPRNWQNTATPGQDLRSYGRIEIATDSGGSTIVASSEYWEVSAESRSFEGG
jgi:hypothetical protein